MGLIDFISILNASITGGGSDPSDGDEGWVMFEGTWGDEGHWDDNEHWID